MGQANRFHELSQLCQSALVALAAHPLSACLCTYAAAELPIMK